MTISLDASQHLIKAVTVFSSRKAEIIRAFSVDLAEGQNELIITSLPSCIDTDSARVTGLGDAVLFDVVCIVDDTAEANFWNTDILDVLNRRHATLEGEKATRDKASDILGLYGRTLNAEYTNVDMVQAFLDSFVERGSNTIKEVEALDKQIAEIDKEIEQEKRKLQKNRQKSAARGRVSAVIMAKRAGKVEVTLTYMVSKATWSPSYDLRATTEDGEPSGTVSLQYRASIQQNTGEDWRDTAISVSTAMPGSWSTIPDLRTMKISPAFQQTTIQPTIRLPPPHEIGIDRARRSPPRSRRRTLARSPSPIQVPASAEAVEGVGEGDGWVLYSREPPMMHDRDLIERERSAWTETKAVVTESAVASSFRIEGKCTIPSEPTAHKVAIAILSFDARINYIAVPRSAPIAFLQCEVKNTSEYRLLRGSVNVFLDDSPVSKTHINDVSREEVFKCTLGPDPSLRIKYTRLPRTVASSGSAYAAQTTVTTYKLITTVHNAHAFPIEGIQVRDAAPEVGQISSSNSGAPGIRVVITHPEGLGEAAPGTLVDVPKASSSTTCSVKVRWEEDGGEKEGKYVWIVDLGPGKEVKLEAEYEIRSPSDFKWQLVEDPFC